MGHAGRELAERGQLFLQDHLILGALEIAQHPFELDVLRPHLLRQHLHQVEPLHLEGMLAEHLERIGHVGHLVAAADVDRGLEVAGRHAPHRGGEARDPSHQHAADEEPRDEHQGHDPDHVEGEQEDEAELDRGLRIGRGNRGLLACGRDDLLGGLDELRLEAAVACEVLLLEGDESKLVLRGGGTRCCPSCRTGRASRDAHRGPGA